MRRPGCSASACRRATTAAPDQRGVRSFIAAVSSLLTGSHGTGTTTPALIQRMPSARGRRSVDAEQLRALQTPLKQRYRDTPEAAGVPARAEAHLDANEVAC